MTNPVHRLKKFVKYAGNEKPSYSYLTEADGWLGSGITDRNGVEICEGDRVKISGDAQPYTAVFENGAFWLNNQLIADLKRTLELEVVGHISEEPT